MLLEGKFTFDVLDPEADFAPYRLLILPDEVTIDAQLKAALERYVAGGGKLLLTGRSGIDPETGFMFDVGADWFGTNPFTGDYALHDGSIRADFVSDPIYMYVGSEQIRVSDGESFGAIYDPYIERQREGFFRPRAYAPPVRALRL